LNTHRQYISYGAIALLMTTALGISTVACEHLPPRETGSVDQPAMMGGGVMGGTAGGGDMGGTAGGGDMMGGVDVGDACSTFEPLPMSPGYTTNPDVRAEVDQIISRMTIEQKVVQLTGVPFPEPREWEDIQRSEDDTENGIKGYQWRDGPHGVNLESGIGRGDLPNYATSFPTTVSQGATFDMDVVYRTAEAMGDETVAAGYNVLLGPCMNILRHPFWGRAQETFGEDVFHVGRIATAFTVGLQQFITGCAKHYVANNIETQRFNLNSEMSERTLREIYTRHFEMVVKDGGVGCVMAAYNSVNGTKSTQNAHILRDILKNEWDYKGFVLTDWWAMPAPNVGQGPVDAQAGSITAADAIKAGLDVEVPWRMNYAYLPNVVADGSVDVAYVDEAVGRVLEMKKRFNSFEMEGLSGLKQPTTTHNPDGYIEGNEHHVELAREVAEKGSVLLKNEGNVLPIPAFPPPSTGTIAVIGAVVDYTVRSDNPSDKTFDWVNDIGLGDRGSSRVAVNPNQVVGALAGITAAAPAGAEVIGGNTAADAMGADYAIVMVGYTAGDEGEEYTGASDRDTLSLGDVHNNLVSEVAALGIPTIVVIQAGAAVDMPWLDMVDGVIMAWYPGIAGGAALGNLIFGNTNFSGRLPITWPASVDQFPTFNEGSTTVMGYHVGYRLFDVEGKTPLFPFGYGLSYSTFSYDGVATGEGCTAYSKNATMKLDVTLTNSSTRDGAEVVQVYASFPNSAFERSPKVLVGFERVEIAAGQTATVTIPIRVEDLKIWDDANSQWLVESGEVVLQVGGSSDQLPLTQSVIIQ
jgi:beta-glucosidase